jgi:hypothetical protein
MDKLIYFLCFLDSTYFPKINCWPILDNNDSLKKLKIIQRGRKTLENMEEGMKQL